MIKLSVNLYKFQFSSVNFKNSKPCFCQKYPNFECDYLTCCLVFESIQCWGREPLKHNGHNGHNGAIHMSGSPEFKLSAEMKIKNIIILRVQLKFNGCLPDFIKCVGVSCFSRFPPTLIMHFFMLKL